jgi:rare lipoprotein A
MWRRLLVVTPFLASGCGGSNEAARFNAPAITTATAARGGDLEPLAQSSKDAQKKPDQVGLATWYGQSFAGKKTASGERFDPAAMTAAHRKLPFNTWVEVRRIDTGGVVRVRITDRGPHGDDRRIIDLSHAAAEKLGFVAQGTTKVEIRIVSGPE